MLTAGIDIGSLSAQAVIVESGSIKAYKSIRVKPSSLESAKAVTEAVFSENGLTFKDIDFCVSTGYGRDKIQAEGFSKMNVSEISCHGRGAQWVLPDVRTVIDVGGQDCKVIRVNDKGELADFIMNDKCAGGTGRFLEVMCDVLDLKLDELGPVSLSSRNPIKITNRCSIYSETEVLHYLQTGKNKADIAAGVNMAMAERVNALARQVGIEKEVVMTGGVAKNVGVKNELERMLGVTVRAPPVDPQIIGALGAALFAEEELKK